MVSVDFYLVAMASLQVKFGENKVDTFVVFAVGIHNLVSVSVNFMLVVILCLNDVDLQYLTEHFHASDFGIFFGDFSRHLYNLGGLLYREACRFLCKFISPPVMDIIAVRLDFVNFNRLS